MKSIRHVIRLWRMGLALDWVNRNNADIRVGARTDGYTTTYGWEVVSRGQMYFSGDLLAAIGYARDMRHNPSWVSYRRVDLHRP